MEVPSRLELKVGESYILKLKGMAAAGYIWSYTVEKNDDQVTVSQSASAAANGGDNTRSSYSLDEVFIIRAIAPGQTKIHFVQRRPWEKDQPPLQEQTVDIVVR